MRCLITGTAGFIGFHLGRRLLAEGHEVVGVDAMTPYYEVSLKCRRHEELSKSPAFKACEFDLQDGPALRTLFRETKPDVVIHLAAQAGVRYSIDHPDAYIGSNLVGTFNLLEACRAEPVQHLLLASTSSVYGANPATPFRETDQAAHPLTLYAATKGSTELMAHSYAHLFGLPTTALRLFTVYGPWGRPDMALFQFVRKILADEPIDVFNFGRSERDFTYVDDVAEAILRLIACPPPRADARQSLGLSPTDSLSPAAPFRTVNLGGGQPVSLAAFIDTIEASLGRTAKRNYLPLPEGDVPRTNASSDLLFALTGYRPTTPISAGIPAFVEWYRTYYGL
jgi:UDP-glucuronate 4-epimerase